MSKDNLSSFSRNEQQVLKSFIKKSYNMKTLVELDRNAFKVVDSETGKLFIAQKSLLEKSKKYS